MDSESWGGDWTEQKLEILRRYLNAYTTVLKNQQFELVYIDAFAGPGTRSPTVGYESDEYREFEAIHKGSPLIAAEIEDRSFDRLEFIEVDPDRLQSLKELLREYSLRRRINFHPEDANIALPRICASLGRKSRAVVFLDPYATQVSWATVEAIAATRKIDCWILFPRSAIARMMPNDNEPSDALALQLDRIFGGRDHWNSLYGAEQMSLLGDPTQRQRQSGSNRIAAQYLKRLESVFVEVAKTRRTFRNSKGSPLFELFFGASNRSGAKRAIPIANHILNRW